MLRNYIYNNNRYIKKIPTLCATTDNITLSGTGQTIDGITTTTNDVVLVKDQTNKVHNGIYEVRVGNWTRSIDMSRDFDIQNGITVYVASGSTLGNKELIKLLQSASDKEIADAIKADNDKKNKTAQQYADERFSREQ